MMNMKLLAVVTPLSIYHTGSSVHNHLCVITFLPEIFIVEINWKRNFVVNGAEAIYYLYTILLCTYTTVNNN